MGEREQGRGGGHKRDDRGRGDDPRLPLPGKRSMTEELGEPDRGPPLLSAGKRALTDAIGGIQLKRTPGSPTSTAAIHDAAARGISTTASALPFADQIQAFFGPEHDVSKIQAHVGSDAPQAMGAEAFASGNHVVFGSQPDLHTVAHEAAHVVPDLLRRRSRGLGSQCTSLDGTFASGEGDLRRRHGQGLAQLW